MILIKTYELVILPWNETQNIMPVILMTQLASFKSFVPVKGKETGIYVRISQFQRSSQYLKDSFLSLVFILSYCHSEYSSVKSVWSHM